MSKVIQCDAAITSGNGGMGSRRKCVLVTGHYVEADEGAGAMSWHTDCPEAVGHAYPPEDDSDHKHGVSCLTWSDQAHGAHYADQPARPSDTIKETNIAAEINKPGRTLTDLGGYRADLTIGDLSLSVYGPAAFVARIVSEAAGAFEEEAER